MGTDPGQDVYPDGCRCEECEDSLFDGVTPKYIEIDVVDVEACPGVIVEPPNGTFLLTQQMDCCVWAFDNGTFVFTWRLTATKSFMTIAKGMQIWFAAEINDTCIDAFVNTTNCALPQDDGHNGYITCWWGPTIGP